MVSSFSVVAAAAALLLSSSPPVAASNQPPLVWDGRIPADYLPKDLDAVKTSPFNTQFNKGKNQLWSDIICFPDVHPSMFDEEHSKPWSLSLNDNSIFQPGDASSRQNGFRRSEVMPNSNNGSDASVQGITTLHFSIQKDSHHPLDFSHTYDVAFLETTDFMSHVWTLSTGTPRDNEPAGQKAQSLRLLSGTDGQKPALLFQADFAADVWHNFAIQVDFDNNALTAYYSTGHRPLKRVAKGGKGANQARGKGQYHIGLLKQPTGPTKDVTKSGNQPSGIEETLIFGGLFIEEGKKVTKRP